MLTEAQKDHVIRFIRSLKSQSFTFRDVVRAVDIDSDDRRSLQHYLDELDSEQVQALVAVLKTAGRLPRNEGSPKNQQLLFAEKSTHLRKDAL